MGVIGQAEPCPLPDSHRWVYERCRSCINAGPYMIGAPSWGCETHHSNQRSVPCYRELPGCTLTCPRCPQRCQWTQYIALIDLTDHHMRRVVYTGGTKTRADVISLAVGTLVSVTRGPNQTDTIRIRVWPDDKPKLLAPIAIAKCQDDLTPYLLHLWQQRELTEHFGQRFIRARGRREREAPPARKVPQAINSEAARIAISLAEGMRPA